MGVNATTRTAQTRSAPQVDEAAERQQAPLLNPLDTRAARSSRRRSSRHVGTAPNGSLQHGAETALGSETRMSAAASEIEGNHRMMTLSILLAGAVDPMALLAGVQGHIRDASSEARASDSNAANIRGAAADRAREVALERAQKMAEKAMSKMPRWAKRLIGAVISAVGTIASVVTGGASLALTVVGVILMAAGEIVQTLAEHGIIDEQNGMIAAVCIKIIGSICTLGAGAVSGGAQIAASTSDIVLTAGQVAKAAVGVAEAAQGGAAAYRGARQMQSDAAQSRGESASLDAEQATEDLDRAAEGLKQTMQGYQRAMKRIHQMVQLQGETRMAAASGWA